MKNIESMTLGFAIALTGWACSAQTTPIPFEQIQRDAHSQTVLIATAGESSSTSRALPADPSATGLVSSPRARVVAPPALGKSFFLLNGLNLGMAVLDVETTQSCIASHRCKEGNPMMPSSQAGQIGINLGLFAFSAGSSYWLKKHQSKMWSMPPVVGVVTHIIGVASGLRFK